MNDLKMIYEAYTNQSGMAWDQQRKKQIGGLTPKTASKISTAPRTSMMPGNNGGNFSQARMGAGVSIDNEEETVNIYGQKMSKVDLQKMILKLIDEVVVLTKKGDSKQLQAKVGLMQTLVKHL